MIKLFGKIFGKYDFEPILKKINSLEPSLTGLTDIQLKDKSEELKRSVKDGGNFEEALPLAFALVREASKRTLGQRHFDVQLIGGIVLNQGKVAEMLTGEGKTLAATAPAYLNALSGKGVHVITVNDYLARRDAVWMGQIYNALGLSISCLTHDNAYLYDPTYSNEKDKERDIVGSFKVVQEFLTPVSRKEAYLADIVYGTNHEFGFDYLRDNLAYSSDMQAQRGFHYCIIDEVDSILIDEAKNAPDYSGAGC